MKQLQRYAPLLFAAWASAHGQEVLITPSYVVTIIGCSEGVVACDDAKYIGVSRKTGNTIQLKGRTVHSKTADGSPGRLMGYEFQSGRTKYDVGADGSLVVTQNEKTLFQESGSWDWELTKRAPAKPIKR
jgi:hypothetical protein